MRRLVCILLALLIPVLADGVSARRLAVAGSASPSEDNGDRESAPQDNQDPAGAQELALVALRMPVALRATALRSFRLRVSAARAPHPGSVRTAARLSTFVTRLRC